MEALVRLAVRRPVAVTMLFVAVLVAGYLSWGRLGVDLLPDVESPKIVVSLRSGDRSPEEMEERWGEGIEAQLVTVRRMKSVSSVSRTGRILVTVEFHWDTDMDFALIDVQKAVGALGADPDVDSLTVQRFDPRAAPIMTLGLLAAEQTIDLDQLRRVGRDSVQRTLERLEGVAEVRLIGGRTREVRVEPDLYKLKAFGVTLDDIERYLRAANVDTPGGTVEDGSLVYAVRGLGRFRQLSDVARVTVGWREAALEAEGQVTTAGQTITASRLVPIRLDEVATVTQADEEVQNLVFVDSREGVGVTVYKEAGANTVQVTRRVAEATERLAQDLPGIELRVVHAQARYIDQAVSEVERAAAVGIALAVLVLFAFLRSPKPTLIVALAIPVSVVTTLVLMYAAELTLNVMTLGGLALGAGMLVDNAIVVVENVYRHLQQGFTRIEAAVRGTSEVAGAITASTLTTVVVFLPIVFVHGLAARLFEEQAFTVGFSLLASLAVALLLIPMAASQLFPLAATAGGARHQYPRLRRLVEASLRRRGRVVLGAGVLFAVALVLLVRGGTEFLPKSDQSQFAVKLRLPEGTRVENTAAGVHVIEAALRENYGPYVEGIYAEVGLLPEDEHLLSEEATGENTATIRVALTEPSLRPSAETLVTSLDPFLKRVPGTRVSYVMDESGLTSTLGVGSSPLTVEVRGRDLVELRRLTERLRQQLASLPALYNVVSSFQEGPPEVELRLDRVTAAGLGLDLDAIASQVRTQVDGSRVTSFQAEDDERWVAIRFPELPGLASLDGLELTVPGRGPVLLRDVVRPIRGEGAREIYRKDQSRVGIVGAQVASGVPFSEAASKVRQVLSTLGLPSGYRAILGGEEEQRRDTLRQLALAAVLAVVLIYMVLASLFESLVHPFTIMLTVPLALVGVAFALALWGIPMGVMSAIGTILLAGIAVNNSILLVDFTQERRRRGLSVHQALVDAAETRLRPILMTSLTTLLALAPLAFGFGPGASLRAPLAVAVIGGLVASTAVTLLVVPCLYSLLDRLRPARARESGPARTEG